MGLIAVATAANVPEPVIARLNKEIRAIVATPKVSERLRSLGLSPKTSTPEEMTEVVKSQIALWKDVAEKASIPKR
jgi:tripartite-type tricarboxylate transporter receptor subunit TctC